MGPVRYWICFFERKKFLKDLVRAEMLRDKQVVLARVHMCVSFRRTVPASGVSCGLPLSWKLYVIQCETRMRGSECVRCVLCVVCCVLCVWEGAGGL
jgi:hypothetical protein